MAKEAESKSSGGIGVVGLLGVVFVTLKLCGVIDWSWWWVTAPFWGGLAIAIVVLIVVFASAGVMAIVETLTEKRNRKK